VNVVDHNSIIRSGHWVAEIQRVHRAMLAALEREDEESVAQLSEVRAAAVAQLERASVDSPLDARSAAQLVREQELLSRALAERKELLRAELAGAAGRMKANATYRAARHSF
jgi:hypothetical protein